MAWNSSSIPSCLFINNDNLYRNNIRMVLSRKIHQSDAFIFQSQFILLYSWYWNSFIRHHSPSENNSEKSENWRNDLKKSSNTRPIKKIRWRCVSQKSYWKANFRFLLIKIGFLFILQRIFWLCFSPLRKLWQILQYYFRFLVRPEVPLINRNWKLELRDDQNWIESKRKTFLEYSRLVVNLLNRGSPIYLPVLFTL